jgi:multisubunit Na+/H+ antiporter MnhB subunit
MSEDASIHLGARGVLVVMLLAVSSAVAWALVSTPSTSAGLWPLIDLRLEEAGAANPVTAVLLNFRAYDTLLEIVVLMIALLGIWSLRESPAETALAPSGRVLRRVVGVLVPLMVLIAGYLLWAGASLPGGAFPAGAVAAAAGVLVLLAGIDAARISAWLLRVGIVIGLLTFVGVGLASVSLRLNFLEYPQGQAGLLILAVESAATVSISLILAGAFAGGAAPLTRPTSSASRGEGSSR